MEKLGAARMFLRIASGRSTTLVGVGIAALVLVLVILGTLIGAFGGWFVGLFFGDTILGVMATMGVEGITMWQLGATLGFIGGFFRNASITNSTS